MGGVKGGGLRVGHYVCMLSITTPHRGGDRSLHVYMRGYVLHFIIVLRCNNTLLCE